MLNEKQKEINEKLHAFVKEKGDNLFLVTGYAGTGKTYLATYFVKEVIDKTYKRIAITAPTNKAVKVLRNLSTFDPNDVSFLTIHSLLGLKEDVDENGKQVFVNNWEADNQIEYYDIVIIDESSMLSEELFEMVIKYKDIVKFIFLGDDAQIPPLNHTYSPVLDPKVIEELEIHKEELTEIIRQKEDSPILGLATYVRNNLLSPLPVPRRHRENTDEEGVYFLNFFTDEQKGNIHELLTNLFKSEDFKEDSDYVKVLAWTNDVVNRFNESIRKILFGENIKQIEIGERLVANKPIFGKMDVIDFSTNDEFEVINYEIKNKRANRKSFKTYLTQVSHFDVYTQSNVHKYINILHDDDKEKYNETCNELKEAALKFIKGSDDARKAWKKYYRFLKKFADVKYAYAMTSHKSQGSTYDHCIVFEDDIDRNRNIFERNRIKYTAFTRPRKNLYILTNKR